MNTILRATIVLLLTACVSCVVYLTWQHKVGDFGVETDLYSFYAPTAQALENGHIKLDDFHPPLYGWLLGLIAMTHVLPGEFEAALLISVLSYLAIVLLIWLIARVSFPKDETIAGYATVIVACNPGLMEFACRADVHILYLALSLGAIYFALRKNAWMTGVLVALALWTRYTWFLSIIPLFFIPPRKAIPAWSIAAAAWTGLGLLTLAYQDVWMYNLNHISFAAGLYNTEMTTNPGLWDRLHQAEFEHLSLLGIVLHDPGLAAKSVATHFGVYAYKTLIFLMVLPTGILAVFGLRKKYWGNFRHPLLIWTAVFFIVLTVTFWDGQYVLGLIPLLGLAAALQLTDLPFPRIARWVAPVIILGLAVWGCVKVNRVVFPGPVSIKYVALSLRDLPGERVAARDPRVFYYSGKKPGKISLTDKGLVRLDTDYIFISPYEGILNDTLMRIFNQSNFIDQCENMTPWSNQHVKVLKFKSENSVKPDLRQKNMPAQ
jgi:hypothetical protein